MVWWKPSGRRQQLQKKKSSGRKGRSQGGNRCCCEHVQVLRGRSSCRQWFSLTVKLGVLGLGLIGLKMQLSPSKMPEASPETEGEQRCPNSELWHACAGPLVSLPVVGSRVIYFPQGHSEQVAASTNKEVDAQIPNYPNLPPQLICQLHNVTMHADVETEEVYAQMTLQPLSYGGEANIRAKTSGGRNTGTGFRMKDAVR